MFKDDFVWGVACSAYQYEGRDPQDGAGECMWDTFCKSGRVYEQQNAEVTCDGIHRYPEDFRLMALLGIKAYRFSISWSRILPNGTGEVNPKGIALYRDMLKELRQNGIRPYITLYHWEMPQALSVQGMVSPDIMEQIENYRPNVLGWKVSGAGGGGYLIFFSENPIENAIQIRIRR